MKLRVVAVIKDEQALLPVFLSHYDSYCDSIVLWDNGSSDRTLEIARAHPKVELRHFTSDGFDTASVFAVLHQTRAESVGHFDWCLFPDCDELILSRQPGREREVLAAAPTPVLAPRGYCLVQHPDEPPLDLSRDVLEQRRRGYLSPPWSKPIVARPEADFKWHPGRHFLRRQISCPMSESDELVLVHLDTIDFALWLKRKQRRISEADRAQELGTDRWDRAREDYERLWADELAKAVDLDATLPRRLYGSR